MNWYGTHFVLYFGLVEKWHYEFIMAIISQYTYPLSGQLTHAKIGIVCITNNKLCKLSAESFEIEGRI